MDFQSNVCDRLAADWKNGTVRLDAYGVALLSSTPEGRGFLRVALDPDTGVFDYDTTEHELPARLAFELDHCERGEGAVRPS